MYISFQITYIEKKSIRNLCDKFQLEEMVCLERKKKEAQSAQELQFTSMFIEQGALAVPGGILQWHGAMRTMERLWTLKRTYVTNLFQGKGKGIYSYKIISFLKLYVLVVIPIE